MWRRLYGDVFEGSMAGKKDALVLFMYLISRADDSGFVRRASVKVVSACTGLTAEEYRMAVEELEAPDPESRSKVMEGRRLVPEEDGWLIVNFRHYQEIQKEEHRRESVRLAVAKHRAMKADVISKPITDGYTPLEERRGEEKRSKSSVARFARPTLQEVEAYCKERKNAVDPTRFLDHYDSNGWKVGKNSMKDWRAAIRTWERNDMGQAPIVAQEASNAATEARREWAETLRRASGKGRP